MATKLKNMMLTSVDLVRAGANQEADICLYKSAEPPEASEQPTEEETSLIKRFIDWMRNNPAEDESEPPTHDHDHEKAPEEEKPSTFQEYITERTPNEALELFLDSLEDAIKSVQEDRSLDAESKSELMTDSLVSFTEAMEELIPTLCETEPEEHHEERKMKKARNIDVIEETN